MNDDFINTVVCDIGSQQCKVGYAGQEAPRSNIPSVLGHSKYDDCNNVFVGDTVLSSPGKFRMTRPIVNGMVTNFDDFETLVHHIFDKELCINPEEHPVLMTEVPLNKKENRERIMQIMFEEFNCPSFYLGNQSVMALFASGRTTGIVLDIGSSVSHVVPVYEGYSLSNGIVRLPIGGRCITSFLQKMLWLEQGLDFGRGNGNFTFSSPPEEFRYVKEKHGYVALDYEGEMQRASRSKECQVSYTSESGCSVTLCKERFIAPELLFKPQLNGFENEGIDQAIIDSIMKCDIDVRKELYGNIGLSGGSTMFPGFSERLHREIEGLAPSTMTVKIAASPYREHATWIGGSIFASLATFPEMVITHEDYNEAGPGIVGRKCF
jgi:actin